MAKEARDPFAGRPIPGWFDEAKLGIFIHWGLFSVPGWAPTTGEPTKIIEKHGWEYWFKHNAYAEWYANSLRLPGSPTAEYHRATYGADFAYEDFQTMFEEFVSAWNPQAWAETFARTGARYVVLVTKHHDGYLLWPSRTPNPFRAGFQSKRDLVGELAEAVRARGMRFGLYYSGGLDWTFEPGPIRDLGGLVGTIPSGKGYADYAMAHWRELVERYQPDVLWNDIGFPAGANLNELFAWYYARRPEGVVNDRFSQTDLGAADSLRGKVTRALLSMLLPLLMRLKKGAISAPANNHADFRTPEYAVLADTPDYKWESTRGVGFSFGYNRSEGDEHHLKAVELVRSFVDVVSKGGNLLLNVGPMADGTIPALQGKRLEVLGNWLAVNGEAVYGARPWQRAEGKTAQGVAVRFTARGKSLYVCLMDRPSSAQMRLPGVTPQAGSEVFLLGVARPLPWRVEEGDLVVDLPTLAESPVYVLKAAAG